MTTTNLTGLTWEWWRKGAEIPPTLGQPNNYVLTTEEVQALADVLRFHASFLTKIASQAEYALRARTTGRILPGFEAPHCHTLASVLEVLVQGAKLHKELLEFSTKVVRNRKEVSDDQLGSATTAGATDGDT
jgi:hypothetical protein